MIKKLLAIIALLIIIATIGLTIGQVFRDYVFPSTGDISTINLDIKWMNGTDVAAFNWGKTENNTAYIYEPVNVTNLSNIPATLTLLTKNLSPTIINLSLAWNYTGTPLQPNDSVILEIEQTVVATGAYSYETVIRGEQT